MSQHPRKVRRSPRFTRFLVTGGIIGLILGFFLSVFGNPDTRYDSATALGFLGLIGALLGVLVGGVIAVLLDKRH